MPKVIRVQKSRKDQGKCSKCSKPIAKGDAYCHWSFAFGATHKRCNAAACSPKASDLTQSEYLGQIYDFQERTFDAESIEYLETERDELVSEIQALGEEQTEKRDNMPETLQDAPSGEMLGERAECCESVASELEGLDISFDGDEFWDADNIDPKHQSETAEEYKERIVNEKDDCIAAALEQRLEEIKQELSDTLGGLE